MQESSAIELRDRWSGRLRAEAELYPESAGRSGEAIGPHLALGLTGSGEEYRLAIRLQDRSAATFEAAEMIREDARGEVEIREIGLVTGLALPIRPLVGGISIGNKFGHPGTLGCAVRKQGTDSPLFLLSNNHVLARINFAKPKEVIEQPAAPDQAGAGPFAVAEFGEMVKLAPQPAHNLVDAAIVEVSPGVKCNPRDLFGTNKRLAGVRATHAATGEPVFKVGKTTFETSGTVKAWGMRMLTVKLGSRLFDFDDQIEILPTGPPFCASGDSGSIVFDGANLAIGLLFGKSKITEEAYANPIGSVFSALGVELA